METQIPFLLSLVSLVMRSICCCRYCFLPSTLTIRRKEDDLLFYQMMPSWDYICAGQTLRWKGSIYLLFLASFPQRLAKWLPLCVCCLVLGSTLFPFEFPCRQILINYESHQVLTKKTSKGENKRKMIMSWRKSKAGNIYQPACSFLLLFAFHHLCS